VLVTADFHSYLLTTENLNRIYMMQDMHFTCNELYYKQQRLHTVTDPSPETVGK